MGLQAAVSKGLTAERLSNLHELMSSLQEGLKAVCDGLGTSTTSTRTDTETLRVVPSALSRAVRSAGVGPVVDIPLPGSLLLRWGLPNRFLSHESTAVSLLRL